MTSAARCRATSVTYLSVRPNIRPNQSGRKRIVKEKRSQKQLAARALACGASLMLLAALRPATARAVGPSAVAPYSFSTFAMSENGYSQPDSITFSRSNIFVGYGNGGNPDGSGGAMSTIVKYKMDGTVVKTC